MGEHSEYNDSVEDSEEFDYCTELERLEDTLRIWQYWIQKKRQRVVLIFEGRVAVGKTAAINCIVKPLPPRQVRVVALPDSSDREKEQWYFQRYITHLPAAGEIVIFDRSWYNRVLVDPFLQLPENVESDSEYRRKTFLKSATLLERLLVNDGIILRKYWLSLSRVEQRRRFVERAKNRLVSWRLSAIDQKVFQEFDEFSRARDEMIRYTDTHDLVDLRWRHVAADDEERARLNIIHDILCNMHYEDILPEPMPWKDKPVKPRKNEKNARATGLYYVLDHYGTGNE